MDEGTQDIAENTQQSLFQRYKVFIYIFWGLIYFILPMIMFGIRISKELKNKQIFRQIIEEYIQK